MGCACGELIGGVVREEEREVREVEVMEGREVSEKDGDAVD